MGEGGGTTASPTNTASTTHSHTGPGVFTPNKIYWNKKINTCIWYSADGTTLTGFSQAPNKNGLPIQSTTMVQ